MEAFTKLIELLRAQVKDTTFNHNKRTNGKCYLNSNGSFFGLYTDYGSIEFYLSPEDLDNSLFGPYVIYRKLDPYKQNCKLLLTVSENVMFEPLQKDDHSVAYSTKKSKSDTLK